MSIFCVRMTPEVFEQSRHLNEEQGLSLKIRLIDWSLARHLDRYPPIVVKTRWCSNCTKCFPQPLACCERCGKKNYCSQGCWQEAAVEHSKSCYKTLRIDMLDNNEAQALLIGWPIVTKMAEAEAERTHNPIVIIIRVMDFEGARECFTRKLVMEVVPFVDPSEHTNGL